MSFINPFIESQGYSTTLADLEPKKEKTEPTLEDLVEAQERAEAGALNTLLMDEGLEDKELRYDSLGRRVGYGYKVKDRKGTPRARVTESDIAILIFVARVRYLNQHVAAAYLQVSVSAAKSRLHRLEKRGFLKRRTVYGQSSLFYLSPTGHEAIPIKTRILSENFSLLQTQHSLTIGLVMAYLQNGKLSVLGLKDQPGASTKIATEPEIQSALYKLKRKHGEKGTTFVGRAVLVEKLREWSQAGKPRQKAPEVAFENRALLTVFPSSYSEYHVPDGVLLVPRASDGRPRSVAIEVELNDKPYKEYERILKSYKEAMIYGSVVWLTPSENTARMIRETRDSLGLSEENVKVILFDKDELKV